MVTTTRSMARNRHANASVTTTSNVTTETAPISNSSTRSTGALSSSRNNIDLVTHTKSPTDDSLRVTLHSSLSESEDDEVTTAVAQASRTPDSTSSEIEGGNEATAATHASGTPDSTSSENDEANEATATTQASETPDSTSNEIDVANEVVTPSAQRRSSRTNNN